MPSVMPISAAGGVARAMRPSGQTGFTRLRSEIRDRTHDSFVDLLANLFAELIPGFTAARRLGEIDRKKVDLFVLDQAAGGLALAVQAKGFEKPYGDNQHKQCLAEIAAYAGGGLAADHYILAVNKRVGAGFRTVLDAELAKLVAKGKVRQAEFLDETRLIGRLRELAFEQLEGWARQALERFQTQAKQRLAVIDYIPDVPFGEGTGVDPANLVVRILDQFRKDFPKGAFGRDVSPPRFLITSSFGFGKTSTLQAMGEQWFAAGGKPIYVPAALLPETAFHNGAGLADAIISIIRPDGTELTDEGLFLLRETLRTEMSTKPGWALLLDGIDESPNWRRHSKLSSLWMSSADMALPLIASVRDEVFHSRVSEFQDGGGRALAQNFFERIALQEWPDALVLRFLDAFAAGRSAPGHAAFLRLRDLVARDAYREVYGDIPRRPLFLGMLAQDAWNGREPETELHLLYENYIRRKLALDRYSAAGAVVRDGEAQVRLGQAEYVERMMLAMEDLAGDILQAGIAHADLAAVDEDVLIARVEARLGVAPPLEDLLLNSLLLPAGRDPKTRRRQVRFAHESFFDWFAARWSLVNPTNARAVVLSAACEAFANQMCA
jgi:hypothetical protein